MVVVLVLVLAGGAGATGGGSGSVSLTSPGIAYTQNFDTLANSGVANTTLPPGWFLDESGTSTRNDGGYAAGTGSDTTGDTYSFGATGSTERAFGGLQSGTLVPTIGGQFTNNTGVTIGSIDIAYAGEQWRVGTLARLDRLDFQISTTATSLTTGTWTDVDALDFAGPDQGGTLGARNGNDGTHHVPIAASVTGLGIPAGASFWIRWLDFNASGADDGLAVDDFSLTPQQTLVPTGVGTATPSAVPAGGSTLLKVAVTPATNPASTGLAVSCDLSAVGGSAPQQFFDDGTNGDATADDNTFSYTATVAAATTPGAKSLPCTVSDAQTRSSSTNIAFTVEGPLLAIHDIQGASHISPRVGQIVSTNGVVTARSSNGFWMQDPTPDANDATSDGIFVFTSSSPTAAVGDAVHLNARVQEFRPGGVSTGNLTTTELASPAVTLVSTGNPLPAPVVVGAGGRIPPTTVIEDDATGNVETSGVFDPASDGLDFWESLEGMRVQLNNAVAVGPTNAFGETQVVGDDGANASVRTARGGLLLRPADPNPERVVVDDLLTPTPVMNVGDHYIGSIIGVLDYNFGNFFLEATQVPPVTHDGVTAETTAPQGDNELAVATFNVENLAPSDPQSKFDRLAGLIVNNLQAPDVISVEEVQDNSGATDNGVVAADQTLTKLVAAIQAAGGPAYQWREIDPVNDQDGGQPGGNIRQVFLFRTDRGLSYVDRPGGDSTTAVGVTGSGDSTQLTFSPGRIDPTNSAWNASRKPLAGEFLFRGHNLFVIANHFNSKGGDNPLEGRFQPPTAITEAQRHQQAQVVHDFVAQILAADPNATIVVDGDLNDYEFSDTVSILEAGVLHDLIDTLPQNERYSYVFEGNSQTLDHVLVSGALFAQPFAFDVVHVNAEFADQASDHDPSVVRLTLVSAESLCSLTRTLVTKAGVAQALCDKLADGAFGAYRNQLDAQAGKAVSVSDAALLKTLSLQLG